MQAALARAVSEEPNTMMSAKPRPDATSDRLVLDTSATLMRVKPPSSSSWKRSKATSATMAPKMESPRNPGARRNILPHGLRWPMGA